MKSLLSNVLSLSTNVVDAALDATDRRGVDAVVDFIGGPYLDRNLCALAWGGRLIQVGTLQPGEGQVSLDLLLHNYLRVIGTVMKIAQCS
jgi:NADPH:quinone reductase